LRTLIAIISAFVSVASAAEPPRPDVFASPPKEAAFRSQARNMVKSLGMPSCATKGLQAPEGFRRADLLRPELKSVAEFGKSIKGTPSQFHFEAAKADADLELARGDGCWAEYNDLAIANRHLKMTQDEVRASLARMRDLSASLSLPLPTSISATDGAEFRSLVRTLIETSRPRCQWTVRADNSTISAPARAEVSQFRHRLRGSPYAAHFDMAEADVAFEYSVVHTECDDPGHQAPNRLSAKLLAEVRKQVAQIERRYSIH
jgi:hypothetical protein